MNKLKVLMCCLLLWLIPWPKATCGEMHFFQLTLPGHRSSIREVRGESKEDTGSRNWSRDHEITLLVCLLWPACEEWSSHSVLFPPPSIISQKTAPQMCPDRVKSSKFLLARWQEILLLTMTTTQDTRQWSQWNMK